MNENEQVEEIQDPERDAEVACMRDAERSADAVVARADGIAAVVQPMRDFAKLHFEIEAEVAALKKKVASMEALGEIVQARLLEMGVKSLPLTHDGQPISVHLHTALHTNKAKDVDMQHACDVLKEHKLGWLVREQYVAATLAAWVKEELAAGRTLPEPFDQTKDDRLFNVSEVTDVRVTRTTRQESASARAARNLRKKT